MDHLVQHGPSDGVQVFRAQTGDDACSLSGSTTRCIGATGTEEPALISKLDAPAHETGCTLLEWGRGRAGPLSHRPAGAPGNGASQNFHWESRTPG